jgi:hypothetical protein
MSRLYQKVKGRLRTLPHMVIGANMCTVWSLFSIQAGGYMSLLDFPTIIIMTAIFTVFAAAYGK